MAQQLGPFFEQAPMSLPGTVARIVIVVCSYFPSSPFQRSPSKQRGGGARRQDQSRVGMQECELVPKNLTKVFQLCGEASRAGDSNGGSLEVSRHPPVQGRYQLHVSIQACGAGDLLRAAAGMWGEQSIGRTTQRSAESLHFRQG